MNPNQKRVPLKGTVTVGRDSLVDYNFECATFEGFKVITSRHVNVRRKERGIKISEIRQTLESPDYTYPEKEKDTFRFVKRFNGSFVHVIVLVSKPKRLALLKTVIVLPTREKMSDENQE